MRPLHEELQLLSRAIEGDTFHFVVVQWHHRSLIAQAEAYLRQVYPERPTLMLKVADHTYHSLVETMYAHGRGIIFIEDFENLLQDPDLYVAFNQRRGRFTRMPVAVVAFLPPGNEYIEQCSRRLADWWSILTILIELQPEKRAPTEGQILTVEEFSTLGGLTPEERHQAMQQIEHRLAGIALTPENAGLIHQLYRHLLTISKTSAFYEKGRAAAHVWLNSTSVLKTKETQPKVYAEILDWAAYFERMLGHYSEAMRLEEQALQIALETLGPDDDFTTELRSNLATVYQALGDYARARDLLEAALASDLKNFGADHPTVAVGQSNLAVVYQALGDYARARDLLEASLSSDLKNFGADHPTVAVRQSNLAMVYQALGDYARARDLLEAALASALKNFGAEHPNVATCLNNLAHVYLSMGDKVQARVLFQRALEIRRKFLGEEHPYTREIKKTLDSIQASS